MSEIREVLAKNAFKFNKRFGQNFITDTNLLDAIVSDAEIGKDDVVLEIGPGAGTLTARLARAAGKVVAYEIDENLRPVLSETLEDSKNAEVVFKDVAKVKDEEILEKVGTKYKLVANLPYYITTPVIMRFIECENKPESITVMVQKEVGDRLVAKAGSAEYGAITAAVRLEGDAEITRIVNRRMFYPVPNVDSCVVTIKMNDRYDSEDKQKVKKLIRAAFAMRRKTLANNLSSMLGISKENAAKAIENAGFSAGVRGETLDVDDFVNLSKFI